MFGLDLAPAILCLIGSLIWAPIVYVAAGRAAARANPELIWLGALGLVALPALLAPAFSASGISLRPAPVIEIAETGAVAPPAAIVAAPAPSRVAPKASAPSLQLSVATLLNAAALLYLYGVVLALAVWAIRTALFAGHVAGARPLDHPRLARAIGAWMERLGVDKRLDIRVSDAVSSVCVYGLRKPVIMVPSDLSVRVSFDDLVLMVAHELAHIRRGDAGLFAAAEASRALFWFNPFARRIADMAELAAEQNADALVLAAGADRRRYAACFVEGLKFAAEKSLALRAAVPAFTPFDRKGRRDRLDAILSGKSKPVRRSTLALGAVAVLAGLGAFAQAALAVAPEPKIVKRSKAAEDIPVVAYTGQEVRAPADGVVVEATDVYKGKPKLGKVVVINHGEGRVSRFGRLESYAVKKGESVERGDLIGVAGDGIDVTYTVADSAPAAPAAPAKPAAAPKPAALPAPAAIAVAPLPPVAPVDDLDTELEGAPDPWDPAPLDEPQPPTPPDAVEPPAPVEPGGGAHGFMQFNGKPFAFRFDKDGKGFLHSKDGKFVFRADDGSVAYAFGAPMTKEDKKRLEQSMKKMREHLAQTGARHSDAMMRMRDSLKDFHFDAKALADIRAKAAADARAFADRWKDERWSGEWEYDCDKDCGEDAARAAEEAMRNREEALEEAARERAEALEDARREREEALEEAAREREEAQAEAQAEREAALAEAEAEREAALAEADAEREAARAEREAALAEAEAEREAARAEREQARAEAEAERAEAEAEREAARAEAEAEREAARMEIENEIQERAQALADAERDLAEEREEIERLRRELAERQSALVNP